MLGRFKLIPEVLRTGRLAVRLFRDARTPLPAKLILGATALYLGSPIDIIPDWFPLVGQADDLMAILAGLNLFIKACPRWLVAEHEDRLDGKRRKDGVGGDIIDGRYRPVD